jgi:hypothetical protein
MSTGPDELTRFLRESLERKIPRPEIERALVDAGWQPHQAKKALSAFAEVDFPVPVPRPARHFSAGQAFAYLVLFSALATAGYSVVELIFRAIEWRFPDPAVDSANYIDHWERSIRWSVARVVIALPVFLFAARSIAKMLDRDPTQRHSPIRRWLTYLAMFVAVCVLIGDFVTLVAWMLGGETTIRFLLKVATVAIGAGAVLAYYLSDFRSDDESGATRRGGMLLAAAATVAATLSVAAGLWLIGSPAEQSARRIDDRRVDDLRGVTTAVNVYFERNKRLPDDLSALVAGLDAPLASADPATGEAYEYRTTGTDSYELCARFSQPSRNVQRDAAWTHGAGRQCFTLKIEEEERR